MMSNEGRMLYFEEAPGAMQLRVPCRCIYHTENVALAIERAGIADGFAEFACTNDATHNLAGTRLGEARRKLKLIGYGHRTDRGTYVQLQLFFQFLRRLIAILKDDKDLQMLAFDWVGLADC